MNNIPAIGDLLVRPKAFGFIKHVGVLIDHNTVLQNTPGKGEHLTIVSEFAAGKPVTVLPTGVHPSVVAARASQILANAKSYDLFSRNCEHTTNEVVRGVARSPQLLFFTALASIVALVVVVRTSR